MASHRGRREKQRGPEHSIQYETEEDLGSICCMIKLYGVKSTITRPQSRRGIHSIALMHTGNKG